MALKCPVCGNSGEGEDRIYMVIRAYVDITSDTGTYNGVCTGYPELGDWDKDTETNCCKCGHEAPLWQFCEE